MTLIRYNQNKERLEVTFSGDAFSEVLKIMKTAFMTWDAKNKVWTGNPSKVASITSFIDDIDTLMISPDAKPYLEEPQIPQEVEFVRHGLNPDLMLFPPIADFQLEDLKRGNTQNRLLLGLEMGLGKTWIIVNVLNQLMDRGEVDHILIVAPAEALYNWRRELLRFSPWFKEEEIFIASKVNRQPFESWNRIVIMSYRTFLMISDDYYGRKYPKKKGKVKKYTKPTIPLGDWGTHRMIVLDESHSIKNLQARQTHVLHLHKRYFQYRYLATGTPDPNGVEGLYSQLTFLDPGSIQLDYYDWLRTVANLGNRFSQFAINSYKPEEVEKFVTSVQPYVIRRFTKDCLDLPPLIIDKVYVEMTAKHRAIYQALIQDIMHKVVEGENQLYQVRSIFNKFPYLSLALDNPRILNHSEGLIKSAELSALLEKWKFSDHSKIEPLKALVERYIKDESRKVIIWSGHPDSIDGLAEVFKSYHPIAIHGQTTFDSGLTVNEARDQLLQEFRESEKVHLLIASYKVFSQAITLTEATRNIYFDRSYDLTDWLQSIKRTHRIGQNQHVLVHPLIIERSLDERLDRSLERKEDINKHLFERHSLSLDEWRAIFEGADI